MTVETAMLMLYAWVKLVDPAAPVGFPLQAVGLADCPTHTAVIEPKIRRPPPVVSVGLEGHTGSIQHCRDRKTGARVLPVPAPLIWRVEEPFTGESSLSGGFEVANVVGDHADALAWIESSEGMAWRLNAKDYFLMSVGDANASPRHKNPRPAAAAARPAVAEPAFPASDWGADYLDLANAAEQSLTDKDKKQLTQWVPNRQPTMNEAMCRHVLKTMQQGPQRRAEVMAQADSYRAVRWVVETGMGVDQLDAMPATRQLLTDVLDAANAPVFYLKKHYQRLRPQALCGLTPMLARSDPAYPAHPAYPAGHPVIATWVAHVFAAIFPLRRESLLAAAERVGQNRIVAGLHFPSDVLAGAKLGAELARVNHDKVLNRAVCEAVRQEWGLHGDLTACTKL